MTGRSRAAGLAVLAADGAGDVDLDDALDAGTLAGPTAWVFGNEAQGLPADARAAGRRACPGADPRPRREPQPGQRRGGLPLRFRPRARRRRRAGGRASPRLAASRPRPTRGPSWTGSSLEGLIDVGAEPIVRPKQVTPLHPDEIARMVDEALADIAAATDLDALHGRDWPMPATGRRWRWPTGRSAPCRPQAKADAGKRVDEARGTCVQAVDERRQVELEAERDARVLVEEAVDVTLPWDRAPAARGTR